MLKVKDLEFFANKFLMENFDMRLEIPITINGRLTATLGRFRYQINGRGAYRALDIQIAKTLVEYNPDEEVLATLYHECVHYALFSIGLPHRDSDKTFIETCNSLNVKLTRTYNSIAPKHKYVCPECNSVHYSRRKMNGAYCTKCNQFCTYEGKEVK